MPKYTPAPEIEKICQKLVRKFPNKLGNVFTDRIHFWWDESPREKKKYAYVRKIDPLSKHLDPDHDFHFVVSRVMIKDFTKAQLHVLCEHEALHIGPIEEDADGNDKVSLIDHDSKEFISIIAAYGYDWTMNKDCVDPLEGDTTVEIRKPEKLLKKIKDKDFKIAAKEK